MKINLNKLYPWADINNCFTRMNRLVVKYAGEELGPDCEIDYDPDTGVTTLDFGKPERVTEKPRAKAFKSFSGKAE